MILPLEFIPLVRPFLPLHRPLPLLVLAVPPALARLKLRRVDPRPPLDGQRGLVLQVLPRQNPFVEEQENSTGNYPFHDPSRSGNRFPAFQNSLCR